MAYRRFDLPQIGAVTLYKRRGLRNIRLSVTASGQVRVSLPTWAPYKVGLDFVRRRQDWITSQQKPARLLLAGSRIGKAHQLRFIPETGRKTVATRVISGEIRILMPVDSHESEPKAQAAAQRASIRALKKEAEQLLPQRLQALATQHGFDYRSTRIKRLKSRWGSCNERGDITLNCFLMQLPWELIDYVLLHELTHTRVLAHGAPFWTELGQYVPNLSTIRKTMRGLQPALMSS